LLGSLAFAWGKFATMRSVALFVGVILVGVSGHLLAWLTPVLNLLGSLLSGAFAWAFGVAVPAVLAIILIWILAHSWHPKNKAGRLASIAAVALGVMVAAGITNVGLLNGVSPGVTSTVSTTTGG